MKIISVSELERWQKNGTKHQLVDVREYHETEWGTIAQLHIPLADILKRSEELDANLPIVVFCKSGKRGAAAAYALQLQAGLDNVYNLEGGLEAWAAEVDSEIAVYQ